MSINKKHPLDIDIIIGRYDLSDFGYLFTQKVAEVVMPQINNKITSFLTPNLIISQIITGILLGDGLINKPQGGRNPMLSVHCSWKEHNLSMIVGVLGVLQGYDLASGKMVKRLVVKNILDNKTGEMRTIIKVNVVAYSKANPLFMELRNYWYPDGIKRLPSDLGDYLSPIALAYWFMGDGSAYGQYQLNLNTQGFTLEENLMLINFFSPAGSKEEQLKVKYGLNSALTSDKKYKRISFTSQSSKDFVKLVGPWMHPSSYYKFKHICPNPTFNSN